MQLEPHDYLTAEEQQMLTQALANPVLMGALVKVCRYEERNYAERQTEELLRDSPNTNRAISYAARSDAAKGWLNILRERARILSAEIHQ